MKLPTALSVCLTAASFVTSLNALAALAEPAKVDAGNIAVPAPAQPVAVAVPAPAQPVAVAVPAGRTRDVTPSMQFAIDRVTDCEAQLDTARKQLVAARSLVKAAEADLKAARADKEALALREQAQGLAQEAGLAPAQAVKKAIPIAQAPGRQAETAAPAQAATVAPPAAPQGIIQGAPGTDQSQAQAAQTRFNVSPRPPVESQALPKVKQLDFNAADESTDVPVLR